MFSIAYDFTAPPLEQIKYLKAKKPQLHFDYDEMMHEAHHKTFTVAKVTKLDLLSDIQESLIKAKEEGKPYKQWQKELKPILQEKGWWGEVEAINPATGEVKNIYVGSRRLKNIYDTNMRVAYAKGRYESQMQSDGEYFYYSAILDGDTRPAHSKLHGTILLKTDPFWDTNYPPNAWRCRCKVRVYSKKEIESRGMKPNKVTPPNIAHKDWAYNPGRNDNLKKVYEDKLKKINAKSPLAKAMKEEFKESSNYLKQNDKLYKDIQKLYTTKKPKTVELCKSDIFGDEKRVLLSSDSVQRHLGREEITAFDYSLIPNIIDGKAYKQKENTFVLLKKYGRYYRAALKDIKDKDEIFIVSLIGANKKDDYERWIRELDKYDEVKK
ncbi:MAG: minor capsid protein [Sulfurospirillum sp.]|nr:minor capsid protein [Sulfurospirillum sp.]